MARINPDLFIFVVEIGLSRQPTLKILGRRFQTIAALFHLVGLGRDRRYLQGAAFIHATGNAVMINAQSKSLNIALALVGAAFLCASVQNVSAAEEIGDARKVVNTVTGAISGNKRRLSRFDPVYRDERISARRNSSAQLVHSTK